MAFTEEMRASALEARRRTGPERAMAKIQRRQPDLADQLLDMALGRGEWESLDKKDRLVATLRVMEWGMGKPSSSRLGRIQGAVVKDEEQGMVIE